MIEFSVKIVQSFVEVVELFPIFSRSFSLRMKSASQNTIGVILDYLESRKDYRDLLSIKAVVKDSSKKLKVFKVGYLDQSKEKQVLRMEVDLKKQKLSSGKWGNHEFLTVKFKSFTERTVE